MEKSQYTQLRSNYRQIADVINNFPKLPTIAISYNDDPYNYSNQYHNEIYTSIEDILLDYEEKSIGIQKDMIYNKNLDEEDMIDTVIELTDSSYEDACRVIDHLPWEPMIVIHCYQKGF